MQHRYSHYDKSPNVVHNATFQHRPQLLAGGARLARGTAWTTGVDRHEIVTATAVGQSTHTVKDDATNGRFLIDIGELTNVALSFNFDKASDPAAETATLDLWYGKPFAFAPDGVGFEIVLEWMGQYTLKCATTGTGLVVSTSSALNTTTPPSSFMKHADDIQDTAGNPYPWITKIRRKDSGRATRTWDLAGNHILIGQVYPASGVTIGGQWYKF